MALAPCSRTPLGLSATHVHVRSPSLTSWWGDRRGCGGALALLVGVESPPPLTGRLAIPITFAQLCDLKFHVYSCRHKRPKMFAHRVHCCIIFCENPRNDLLFPDGRLLMHCRLHAMDSGSC